VSTPALLFSIYFTIGLLLMVVAVASHERLWGHKRRRVRCCAAHLHRHLVAGVGDYIIREEERRGEISFQEFTP
jgi:hypothetical protein